MGRQSGDTGAANGGLRAVIDGDPSQLSEVIGELLNIKNLQLHNVFNAILIAIGKLYPGCAARICIPDCTGSDRVIAYQNDVARSMGSPSPDKCKQCRSGLIESGHEDADAENVCWLEADSFLLRIDLSRNACFPTLRARPEIELCVQLSPSTVVASGDRPAIDENLGVFARVCTMVLDAALLDEQKAVLHESSRAFAAEDTAAVDQLANFIAERMRFEACSILTQTKDARQLRVVGTTRLETAQERHKWTIDPAKFRGDPAVQVALSHEMRVSNNLANEAWGKGIEALPDKFDHSRARQQFLAVPILPRSSADVGKGSSIVGVLRLRNKQDTADHKDRPIDLLDQIEAHMIADAISPVMSAIETEVKRAEVIAAMRHEMYEPINMIRNAAGQIVENGDRGLERDPEKVLQKLRDIDSLCDLLYAHLGQARLLSYGDLPYTFEKVFLKGEIVVKLNKLFEPSCRDSGLNGIRADDFSAIPALFVDRRTMHVVFYNLYKNATKYADAGTEVEVTTSADRDNYYINVSNHGLTINPDERELVFEKWYRGPKAVERAPEGMGLGLFHVRQIIEKHAGKVFVTSLDSKTPGGSKTTFTVALPRYLDRKKP
jgi:signal transduction histidine kinase